MPSEAREIAQAWSDDYKVGQHQDSRECDCDQGEMNVKYRDQRQGRGSCH